MQFHRYSRSGILILAASLLLVSGCNKKKPSVPPPQAQAPTVTEPTTQQTQTAPAQEATPEKAPATEPPPATTPTPAPEIKAQKPSPIKRRKSRSGNGQSQPSAATTKKPPAATPPAPSTTVAKASPPAPDAGVGQISPDMSQSTASQTQQSTTQLLDTTEQNLRNLNRTLSNDELDIVSQIRSYINQAKAALKDQDLERAHNLAAKARQLSEGLLHP